MYVDKTQFVWEMAKWGGYYFLSRPRRFGKSLLLSTLEYLHQGKKELFEGLFIESKWDWSKKNPVIKISFSNIGHKEKGLKEAINDCLDATAKQYNISLESVHNSGKFKELIENLAASLGSVVILIDEYDKPIIDYLGTGTQKAIENREILKSFYSILKDADQYIKLVFITGVSKFSRVSIFSDLNNLTDLTIGADFAGVCGITQNELEDTFEDELKTLDKNGIKSWYNGYSWGGTNSVYNPFSLLHFLRKKKFENFWFETGTPTFLINLVKHQELYDFEGMKTNLNQLNAYDLEKLQSLPLMFQTGYLTIKSEDEATGIYTLDYPNIEVKQSFMDVLMNSYTQNPSESGTILAHKLREILKNAELEKLQSLLNSLFKSIPYEIWQKENEHYYHAIIHLTFRLLGVYIESQVQTSDGRIDALVQTPNYVYAFEFKLGGKAKVALQQVKDKGYLIPYLNQNKICICIGVNFSKEKKQVQEILWEEIKN